MKNLILTTAFFLQAVFVFAQFNGTVYYSETSQLHINIQGNAPPPPGLPTEHTNYSVLYFTQDKSLYMNDESKHEDPMMMNEDEGDGDRMFIQMDAPDNRVYCDLVNKKITRQEDFMQRKFLVDAEMNSAGWKITGNQKMILNYSCMEAIKEDSTQKTVVWFTSAIPVPTGPLEYTGLPGLVLEVNINDGDQVITATRIINEVDASLIEKPKDGKKVTEEEFNAIVDEKMKEMGVERGNGANVIINIDEH